MNFNVHLKEESLPQCCQKLSCYHKANTYQFLAFVYVSCLYLDIVFITIELKNNILPIILEVNLYSLIQLIICLVSLN